MYLECRESSGKLIGGALLTHGTPRWNSMPLGPFGRKSARTFVGNLLAGPFVIDGLSKTQTERARYLLIEELISHARALGCDDLWLGDSPQSLATVSRTTPVNRYLLSDAWENCQRYHFFVDLRTDESARWDGLKQERRTAIRRAKNSGTTVQTGSELKNAEDHFVALMSLLDPVRALTPEKLRSIWAVLYKDARHGEAFFALEDGVPQAFACVLAMGNVASYHLGARIATASSGAHALALWEAICWASGSGYEWFDIGKAVPQIEGSEHDLKERGISSSLSTSPSAMTCGRCEVARLTSCGPLHGLPTGARSRRMDGARHPEGSDAARISDPSIAVLRGELGAAELLGT